MNLDVINLTNIDNLETEEATKMALIMPFIQQLGYNVFDINEVIPEFTADIAKRKGEKIDYAIKIEDKIAFVIEAKHVKENLDLHSKQLARYFVNTEAKIAILTNGLEYRFYTDIDKDNIMDEEPFFIFNLQDHKKKDLDYLTSFSKEKFDETKLYGKAETSRKVDDIVTVLYKEFDNPSEDFLKVIIDKSYDGIKTKAVLDEYREYLLPAMAKLIEIKTADKLKIAFPEANIGTFEATKSVEEKKANLIDTTANEMQIYSYINLMLKDFDSNITYKDNSSYFNVLLDGKVTKWICRVFDRKELKINIYNGEETLEFILEKTLDIFEHENEIKKALEQRK